MICSQLKLLKSRKLREGNGENKTLCFNCKKYEYAFLPKCLAWADERVEEIVIEDGRWVAGRIVCTEDEYY